jgi:hypothetical protein
MTDINECAHPRINFRGGMLLSLHVTQLLCEAENGGGRELGANRGAIGTWEQFRLEDLGNDQVALRASNGQYVTAEGGGGRELVANGRSRAATLRLHRL